MSGNRDEKLHEAIRLYKLLALTIQKSAASAWLDMDLPIAQMRVLTFLSSTQDAETIGTLSERLQIGLPAASRLVERLIKEELVIRAEDPADRRRTLVRLSPRGEALIESLGGVMRDRLQFIFSELNEADLDALLRAFHALEAVITQQTISNNIPPGAH
jgi:DNA-binding MarR family transcriptional regulator